LQTNSFDEAVKKTAHINEILRNEISQSEAGGDTKSVYDYIENRIHPWEG